MKIRIRGKKKIVVISLIVLALILAGSGGYLLWRVNQPDTVAPTDSEAGGGAGPCCRKDIGCVSGWVCDTSLTCKIECENDSPCSYLGGNCQGGECVFPGGYEYGRCVQEEGPPTEGDCKDVRCEWPTVVMSHDNCSCKRCDDVTGVCSGDPVKCTPPACPSGTVSCGVSGDSNLAGCSRAGFCWGNHPDCNNPFVVYRYCKPEEEEEVNVCDSGEWVNRPTGSYAHCSRIDYSFKAKDSDGIDSSSILVQINGQTRNTSKSESATETLVSGTLATPSMCLDPGVYTLTASWKDTKGAGGDNCTLTTTFSVGDVNICDGGDWIMKPTGTYEYCSRIDYSFLAEDSDGIKQSSILVELNGERKSVNRVATETDTLVSGTLATPLKCLAPGSYTLTASWEDEKGATGPQCNLEATFVVASQALEPDWRISKIAAEQCIDENTATPKSQLTYAVDVLNVGLGAGELEKVEDKIDSKISDSQVSQISNGGTISGGVITWNLTGTDQVIGAEEYKRFTYVVTIPHTDFGTYENVVTAYPKSHEPISTELEIDADCIIEEHEKELDLPETGIFSNVETPLILGTILLFLGFGWTWISDKLSSFKCLFVNNVKSNTVKSRREKLEKKVGKNL